jgi:hydroxysqualene synthase
MHNRAAKSTAMQTDQPKSQTPPQQRVSTTITAINPATHYENFPVGSWLVPSSKRPIIHAIYRFARFADDLADEGDCPARQRIMALEALKLGLEENSSAFHEASSRAFEPEQANIARAIIRDIEDQVYSQGRNDYKKYLTALLDAFIQDSENSAQQGKSANPMFQDEAGLMSYCERSANPVGRMMLLLFDCHKIELLNHSDAICTGLQWINFMQDVSIDREKGRIYCPANTYTHTYVYPFKTTSQGIDQPSAEVILAQTLKARAMLVSGKPLLRAVPLRLSLELRAILAGGLTLADKIISAKGATQNFRPKLTKADALVLCKRFFWLR